MNTKIVVRKTCTGYFTPDIIYENDPIYDSVGRGIGVTILADYFNLSYDLVWDCFEQCNVINDELHDYEFKNKEDAEKLIVMLKMLQKRR